MPICDQAFREFATYEAAAIALWTFQHTLMPGLLQTEDYARAVLERHPGTTPEQVTQRVAARMARQSVLDRDRPPRFWVLLDENALHREVGGAKIMHDQISHLANGDCVEVGGAARVVLARVTAPPAGGRGPAW
jgi:Domain of unknown function (DUF5753)